MMTEDAHLKQLKTISERQSNVNNELI